MKKSYKSKAFSLIELSIVVLVVGVLIAGVMQSRNMLDKTKLSSARTLTQSSPVPGIKDLILWLDTTSEKSFKSTETSNNTVVSYWYDINPQMSAQRTHFSNSSSTSPTYKESCINGLPCLYFDGNAGVSGLASVQNFNIDTKYITMFAVVTTPKDNFTPNSGTPNGIMIFTSGAPLAFGTSGNLVYQSDQGAGYGLLGSSVNAVSLNKNYIFSVVDNYTASSPGILAYINGAASNASVANGNNIKLLRDMQIGWFPSVGWPENYKGNMAEIIIYAKALTTEERKAVEKYLSQKWAINLS